MVLLRRVAGRGLGRVRASRAGAARRWDAGAPQQRRQPSSLLLVEFCGRRVTAVTKLGFRGVSVAALARRLCELLAA
jgi:hypothetical protein